MDRGAFLAAINRLNIAPDAYSLQGRADEAYVLEKRLFGWVVYYAERGRRTGLRRYRREAAALDDLAAHLKRDRSARRNMERQRRR